MVIKHRLRWTVFLVVICVAAAAGLVWGSLSPDSVTAPHNSLTNPPRGKDQAAPEAAEAYEPLTDVVRSTLERNPFRPDRSQAFGRYTVLVPQEDRPTDNVSIAEEEETVREAVPQFRLSGLIVSGNHSGMAALQVQGANPRLLSVNDTISGFRLASVTAVRATLTRRDTTIVLVLQ